jgi:HPt (histidine-containing phosphotransfer) domain-containing protein
MRSARVGWIRRRGGGTLAEHGVPAPGEPPLAGDGHPVPREVLLDCFDGDETLMREAAGLFLEDAPAMLAALETAVSRRDAAAARLAAHTLEGCASNFAATELCDAAERVGGLARSGALSTPSGAERTREACGLVAAEVERLGRQLASIAELAHA